MYLFFRDILFLGYSLTPNKYLVCVMERQGSGADLITDINDVRNGILLYDGLDRLFGDGEIAFL